MKKYYHGTKRRGPYFEGWYLKCLATDGKALALIPALHIDSTGRRSASLQVIADSGTWCLDYLDADFHASEHQFQVRMGHNLLNSKGIWLNLERKGLSLRGNVSFGPFSPPSSDIMGPFRFVPGMECSHGVISMAHTLEGELLLNGETIDFSGGTGYVETDLGHSFPSVYLWTQCTWQTQQQNSLMLAVAAIPLAAGHFTGCICAIRFNGREYRLATYRGARVERWSNVGAVIRQGQYCLVVELLKGRGQPLHAPVAGCMRRTVHESLCATIRCRFWAGGEMLFDHVDPWAGFEYDSH